MSRFIVLLYLFFSMAHLVAQNSKDTRDSLRGISAVRVVVEDVDSDAAKDGLTTEQLRTDVELRLRRAGLKVDSENYLLPYVYVRVQTINNEGLYACGVEVSLTQWVTAKISHADVLAKTWSVNGIAIVGASKMSAGVRGNVADFVDKFLNAWLEVNPK